VLSSVTATTDAVPPEPIAAYNSFIADTRSVLDVVLKSSNVPISASIVSTLPSNVEILVMTSSKSDTLDSFVVPKYRSFVSVKR